MPQTIIESINNIVYEDAVDFCNEYYKNATAIKPDKMIDLQSFVITISDDNDSLYDYINMGIKFAKYTINNYKKILQQIYKDSSNIKMYLINRPNAYHRYYIVPSIMGNDIRYNATFTLYNILTNPILNVSYNLISNGGLPQWKEDIQFTKKDFDKIFDSSLPTMRKDRLINLSVMDIFTHIIATIDNRLYARYIYNDIETCDISIEPGKIFDVIFWSDPLTVDIPKGMIVDTNKTLEDIVIEYNYYIGNKIGNKILIKELCKEEE